ncbi:MAG: hypothetical protein ACOC1O_03835, partial [bacterium]
ASQAEGRGFDSRCPLHFYPGMTGMRGPCHFYPFLFSNKNSHFVAMPYKKILYLVLKFYISFNNNLV